MGLAATLRLFNAGYVLAREGALSVIDVAALPPVMKNGVRLGRLFERGSVRKRGPEDKLRAALDKLGPTYVKFGLTLATRPDIVGIEVAAHLALLQDKMEPFDAGLVPVLLKAVCLALLKPAVASMPVKASGVGNLRIDSTRY